MGFTDRVKQCFNVLFGPQRAYVVGSGASLNHELTFKDFNYWPDALKYYEDCSEHYVELMAILGENSKGLVMRKGWENIENYVDNSEPSL